MLSLEKADEYFQLHLLRDEWMGAPEDSRKAALNMAEQDVSLELGGTGMDYADIFAVGAVCEQAVFLLTSQGDGINPVSALLQSESVDGIGSRTYRSRSNPAIFYKPLRNEERIFVL